MADVPNSDRKKRQQPQRQDPEGASGMYDEDGTPLPTNVPPADVSHGAISFTPGSAGGTYYWRADDAEQLAARPKVEPMPGQVENRPQWLAAVLRLVPEVVAVNNAHYGTDQDKVVGPDTWDYPPVVRPLVEQITKALADAADWVKLDSRAQDACASECPDAFVKWLVALRHYVSDGHCFPYLGGVYIDDYSTQAEGLAEVVQPIWLALEAVSYPATKPETDDDPETALRQVMHLLRSDKWPHGQLKKPPETLLEAIEKRPDAVRIRGDESGIRRYLGSLNRRFPGIRQCFVISGRTVTFLWDRFRIHCHPAPD